VLPGIGPALTVALLLPVTYNLEPTSAFIMFAGIYYGAMYGGSTTSILLNTPGESGSIVTAIDGNMMARQGRGAQALATAAIGSFVAGTIADPGAHLRGAAHGQAGAPVRPGRVLRAHGAGPGHRHRGARRLARARPRQPASRAWRSGLVGIDLQTGQARFTLGIPELLDGIDTVVVAVGLFASARRSSRRALPLEKEEIYALTGSMWMSREDWARSWKPWLRGTASASRSGPCRPAAARSRPSSPT
jgi:putative tricarboxylic transport membrane protein